MIDERGFSLGGVHHRVISLKNLPEVSFATMASKLTDLPFESDLYLSIKVPSQQSEIQALQSQRRLIRISIGAAESSTRS